MRSIRWSVVGEIVVIAALLGAFLYFTLSSANAQYGNPYDPYLDYQRHQREIESLDLQRRQVQAIEINQALRWVEPLPQIVDPWAPELQAWPR